MNNSRIVPNLSSIVTLGSSCACLLLLIHLTGKDAFKKPTHPMSNIRRYMAVIVIDSLFQNACSLTSEDQQPLSSDE